MNVVSLLSRCANCSALKRCKSSRAQAAILTAFGNSRSCSSGVVRARVSRCGFIAHQSTEGGPAPSTFIHAGSPSPTAIHRYAPCVMIVPRAYLCFRRCKQ